MKSKKATVEFFRSKLFMLLALLLALLVIFTVWSALIGTKFLTRANILSIIDSMIVTSFLAVGAGFLMVSGNLDLSAANIGAFGGVFMAASIKYWGMSSVPAALLMVVVTLACCGLIGIFNAVLVNEFNFQPFIATLAMASVVSGLTRIVSVDPMTKGATTVNASSAVTNFLGSYKVAGIPVTIFLMILVFIVYGLILSRTKFGKQMYLVGGNRQAAFLCGISPKKISYILFANSAVLAGVSGIILMGRTRQGNIEALGMNQFTGLTAAILGGISFGGGSGSMAGVFVGILVLNTFSKGATSVHFDTYWTSVLSGLLLLIALAVDSYYTKKHRKV